MSYYSCGIHPPRYEAESPFAPFITEEQLMSTTATQPYAPAQATSTSPNPESIPEYLRSHIGCLARVEFLLGGGMVDKVGRIRQAGNRYVMLDTDCAGSVMCDLSDAKFVTILGR